MTKLVEIILQLSGEDIVTEQIVLYVIESSEHSFVSTANLEEGIFPEQSFLYSSNIIL